MNPQDLTAAKFTRKSAERIANVVVAFEAQQSGNGEKTGSGRTPAFIGTRNRGGSSSSSSDSKGTLKGQCRTMLTDLVDGWDFPQFVAI